MSENWQVKSIIGNKSLNEIINIFGSNDAKITTKYMHFNLNNISDRSKENLYKFDITDTQKESIKKGNIYIENKKDIISMKISPIYISGLDTLTAREWFNRRADTLMVLIEEFIDDAIILNPFVKCHFILRTKKDNMSLNEFDYNFTKNYFINRTSLYFYPVGDGKYIFKKPVIFPDTITLRFIPDYKREYSYTPKLNIPDIVLPFFNINSHFEIIVDGNNGYSYLKYSDNRTELIPSYFFVDLIYFNKKFPHKAPSIYVNRNEPIENVAYIEGEYCIVSVARYGLPEVDPDATPPPSPRTPPPQFGDDGEIIISPPAPIVRTPTVLEYKYDSEEIDILNETLVPLYFSPLYVINRDNEYALYYPQTNDEIKAVRVTDIPIPLIENKEYIITLQSKQAACFDFTIKTHHNY
jgi:hypothetical protein